MPLCDMTGAYEKRVNAIEQRIQNQQDITYSELIFYLKHLHRNLNIPERHKKAEQALLSKIDNDDVRVLFELITHTSAILDLAREINRGTRLSE